MTASPPSTLHAAIDDDVTSLIHVPATNIAERVHPEAHLLLWQPRGTTDFRLRTQERQEAGSAWTGCTLTAGHALWIPAGTCHKARVHENSTMLSTLYPVETTAVRLSGPVIVPVNPALQTLILTQIQKSTTIIRPRANIARQILSLIEDAPKISDSLPTPTSPPARRVAEAIRFNPGDDRTASELAAHVHTSLRTIQRQFSAETGLSLQQWRTRVRISVGAELLRGGDSLAAVANRTGYSDISSFCRAFKTHHGTTTREYLRQYAAR